MEYLTGKAAVLASRVERMEVVEWELFNFNHHPLPYRRTWREKLISGNSGNRGPLENSESYVRRLARSGQRVEQEGPLYLIRSGVALDFIILGEEEYGNDQDMVTKFYNRLEMEYLGWMTEKMVPSGKRK